MADCLRLSVVVSITEVSFIRRVEVPLYVITQKMPGVLRYISGEKQQVLYMF